MKYSSTYIAFFTCCALGGCATPQMPKADNAQGEIDRHILEASRKIERMQLQLVQAGALGHSPGTVSASLASTEKSISFSWKGDAYQLLSKLASERGMEFIAIGVRLPLPVAIQVKDKSFEDVLDAIRAQTGYRAAVLVDSAKLTLRFNRPQEGKS